MGGLFGGGKMSPVVTMTKDLLDKQDKDREAERQAGLVRAEDEMKKQRQQPKFKRASQRLLAEEGATTGETATKTLLGG